MQQLVIVLIFIFGACVGSFLNVVILRLPQGLKLTGRSACPQCKNILGFWDLFPIFSFIFLQGKCRYCQKKISWRYPLIEIVTGLLFVLVWQFTNPVLPQDFVNLFRNLLVVSSLVIIFVIDWEHYLILDTVVFPVLVVVLILNGIQDLISLQPLFGWQSHFFGSLIGAGIAALPFFIIWFFSHGQWMGFGDVKFALLLGVIFGWPLVLVNIMVAVLLGGVVSVILLLSGNKSLKSHIAFGTFLSLGAIISLFYGPWLLTWYLSYLGF